MRNSFSPTNSLIAKKWLNNNGYKNLINLVIKCHEIIDTLPKNEDNMFRCTNTLIVKMLHRSSLE